MKLIFYFTDFQNGNENNENVGSRFSRWFNREQMTPQKVQDDSRQSSIQEADQHNLIKKMLADITEPSISIPGDSESYFAPISPAANTGGVIGGPIGPPPNTQGANLMEMIQREKHKMMSNIGDGPRGTIKKYIIFNIRNFKYLI